MSDDEMRLLLGVPVCLATLGLGIAFLFFPRKVRDYQLRWPGFDEKEIRMSILCFE